MPGLPIVVFDPSTVPAPATSGAATSIGPNKLGVSPLYAPADHTHDFGAAIQRQRVAVPQGVSQSITWTFDTPFVDRSGAPVIPAMGGPFFECPTTSVIFEEPQMTALSSTSVTVLVRCTQSTLTVAGALPVNLQLGAASIPANTFLHLSARNPTV